MPLFMAANEANEFNYINTSRTGDAKNPVHKEYYLKKYE